MANNGNGNHDIGDMLPDFIGVERDEEICAIGHMVEFMEQADRQTRRRVFKYLGDRFATEDWTPIKLET